jgi:uncharacterized protein HemX
MLIEDFKIWALGLLTIAAVAWGLWSKVKSDRRAADLKYETEKEKADLLIRQEEHNQRIREERDRITLDAEKYGSLLVTITRQQKDLDSLAQKERDCQQRIARGEMRLAKLEGKLKHVGEPET